ncbi:replicative DNA helicase [Oryzomonas sagensis]|uniref:Replicative DNA helicase n=1 Tax=Oryzomonas sagensis TaxID=2603857 RepID=A0ABQ6TL41_9BACT|nr:replicative DNA helicase [Oryzomonas sagensis]KAB0668953.1 replicative DNA helicase [Oryzomonas sagensis]
MQDQKLPPQDAAAEMSVLGSIFLDNETVHTALSILSGDDFYREPHRKIFGAMVSLSDADSPIDAITLNDELRRRGDLEAVGGMAYILTLADYTPTAANCAYYCRIVKDRALNRRMITVGNELTALGYAEEPGAGELLESALMKLSVQQKNEPVAVTDLLRDANKRLQARHDRRGQVQGMSFGIPALDNITEGLHRGDLVIIAGRPSMGKSALASNIAENICGATNDAGMIFSLEMSRENIMDRMITSRGRINYTRMRSGQLHDTEWTKCVRAQEQISRMRLLIDDTPAISLREIRSKCRKQKRSGLDLVVVDYLQLMRMSEKNNRSQEVGECSRGLKQLARELDCAVVLLSQLSRAVENRPNKKPTMSDLRDSGEIEQDADMILFPFRPAVYCQKCIDRVDDDHHNLYEHMSVAELIIAKQRNGEANRSIPLIWLGEFQRFEGVE